LGWRQIGDLNQLGKRNYRIRLPYASALWQRNIPMILGYKKVSLTPLSTLYNSLILKGLKFNNFLAKNCKPSIYKALEKRVESQVQFNN
jgi:hypothetical protein